MLSFLFQVFQGNKDSFTPVVNSLDRSREAKRKKIEIQFLYFLKFKIVSNEGSLILDIQIDAGALTQPTESKDLMKEEHFFFAFS